ncbi:hypothetical protein V8B97DRAFT_1867419, partial [Scleroderma yunnanense]
ISKQDICSILQKIIPIVYLVLKNTTSSIDVNLNMVSVVSQHLCNWRHGFASAAVTQLTTFFLNPPDPSLQDTVQLKLEHFVFLYEDLNPSDPEKAFLSVFVQQLLLMSHLNTTKGYVQVPTLDTQSLKKHGMVGTLGLCSAALQCGLTLIKSGDIELKSPVSNKGSIAKLMTRDVQTPKKLNMASGKDSRTACTFSDQNWGVPTRKLTSAAKRRTAAQLQCIVEMAHALYTIGDGNLDALRNTGSEDEYALICRGSFLLISMTQLLHLLLTTTGS